MPISATRRFLPYAEAAEKKGIKVYHLNIGEPDLDSPPEAIEVIKNYKEKSVRYTHSKGNMSLLEGMVKYYATIGVEVNPENINVTDGGTEELQMAISITCNPEDELILIEPFYTNYGLFSYENDVKIKAITTKIEEDFELPPMGEIEKVITSKTKAILICNPSNPTGKVYKKETLIELGKLLKSIIFS